MGVRGEGGGEEEGGEGEEEVGCRCGFVVGMVVEGGEVEQCDAEEGVYPGVGVVSLVFVRRCEMEFWGR